MEKNKKLVVIGGGAAGFFCAVNAARLHPDLHVTIFEKSNKLLSKVKVSGGGRCNVTHACFSIAEMIKKYPRGNSFLKKAFHHFFTTDTIDWFKERGVTLKTESDGRMFPVSNSSQTIVDCLIKEANKYKVEVLMNAGVVELEIRNGEFGIGNLELGIRNKELEIRNEKGEIRNKELEIRNEKVGDNENPFVTPNNTRIQEEGLVRKTFANSQFANSTFFNGEERFLIQLENGKKIEADFICIACGGFPKSIQFEWLKKLGHSIEAPVPSLFTFNMPGDSITSLMGIAIENASVKILGSKLSQQGTILITHWGMSGPAVLKLSAWGARELAAKNWHFKIAVNWVSDFNENTLREKLQQIRFEHAAQKIINRNPFGLPTRFWEYLLKQSQINPDLRWADLPAKEQNKLIKNLCGQEFEVKGKTGFKEEFVTCGGINLNEIDHNTMQSKIIPNLFFAGEVIDVDGITGGFNFQNAWTTGFIAAKAIAQS